MDQAMTAALEWQRRVNDAIRELGYATREEVRKHLSEEDTYEFEIIERLGTAPIVAVIGLRKSE